MTGNDNPEPRRASPFAAVKTVFWAFFGVRRGRDHAAVKLSLAQIVIAGLVGAAVFVLAIVTVVRLVTR
ncbi:MAG: DUF2970 domain-containing protein [Burkholderiales bacterium]|nr:DUF2970 domain-containing protein [Burkholderiales bacterium]